MTKGVVWCRDGDDVSYAASIMRSKQIRRLPVIDKNKRMVGMLSLGICRMQHRNAQPPPTALLFEPRCVENLRTFRDVLPDASS